MRTLVTIIVPEDMSYNAAYICQLIAGVGGSNMFTTKLSPTGNLPATHSVSSGVLSNSFVSLLSDTPPLLYILGDLGCTLSEPEVLAILQEAIISFDTPQTVLENSNLKIICSAV